VKSLKLGEVIPSSKKKIKTIKISGLQIASKIVEMFSEND